MVEAKAGSRICERHVELSSICPEYTLSPMVQWKMAIFERGVTSGGTHFFTEP